VTVTSFASRYLLCCDALETTREDYVFELTFRDCGLPSEWRPFAYMTLTYRHAGALCRYLRNLLIFGVAGERCGLIQYSRSSALKASGGPSCRQAAPATATNSRPTTWCPLSKAPAGAAANAGPSVPLAGAGGGGPRRSH
jgi:hypothetical protein